MRRPDTPYGDHVIERLASLLHEGAVCPAELEPWRAVVEEMLLLDLERIREELESLLPSRVGGRSPRDQVLMARSMYLAHRLAGGRLNRWVRMLKASPLARVLVGLGPEERPPSVGAHYAFCRRLLGGSADAVARDAELRSGHRGIFHRADLGGRARPDTTPTDGPDGPVDRMRRVLTAAPTPELPRTLDAMLTDWLVDVGIRCLVEHGVLDEVQSRLDLALDGTVHRSHACPRGVGARTAFADEEAGAEQPAQPTRERVDRAYSDPSATWRYSNGSRSLEFGHLGLAATVRVGQLDVPLLTAFAKPGQGETPAMMEAVTHLHRSLQRHLPQLRIRSVIGDAGFDAAGFYRWAAHHRFDAIVAPHPSFVTSDPTVPRAADGTTPLCAGNLPMKRHQRQGDSITWRCPAQCLRRGEDGIKRWTFDATICPFAASCSASPLGPFLSLAIEDNPRLNLPVPRHSEEFRRRMRTRTGVERHFAHLHTSLPDRTYRRLHLWQIGCAMHALSRQMAVVRTVQADMFRRFWNTLLQARAPAAA